MKKIFFLFVFLTVVLFCAVIFSQKIFAIALKNRSIKELGNRVNTRVDIDSLDINLFKGIVYFSGLRAENPGGFNEKYFADIKRGYVDISLHSLLFGDIRIQKIFLDRPNINIEINSNSVSNTKLIFKKKAANSESARPRPKMQKDSSEFRIDEIIIRNGVFKLANYKVNQDGAEAVFDEIYVSIRDLTDSKKSGDFPTSVQCSANLPASNLTGHLELSARGSFLSDLIDFDLGLEAQNISLPYFMPFYVNSAPILAGKGSFNLNSAAECRKNNLKASQKVNIRDLGLVLNRKNTYDNSVFGLPVMTVISYFMNSQGILDFDFEITGTLSDPKFHIGEALKKVLARSIGNAILNRLSQLPGEVFEKAKENGDINIEDAGKEILRDVFQKILAPNREQQDGKD